METGIGVMAEDLLEQDQPAVPYLRIATSAVVLFSFIPISVLLGMSRLEVGPRWFQPLASVKLSGYFLAYAFVIYFFFLWPVLQWVAPVLEKRSKVIFVLGLMGFVTPPLLSYIYYLSGGANGWEEWVALLLTVVPATLLSTIYYVKCRRHWVYVLLLIGLMFVPVYIVNDVMARLYPMFQYWPKSQSVLNFRVLAFLASLSVAVYPRRGSSPVWPKPSRNA